MTLVKLLLCPPTEEEAYPFKNLIFVPVTYLSLTVMVMSGYYAIETHYELIFEIICRLLNRRYFHIQRKRHN